MVSLKIVFNVSRFKSALNWNRFLADLRRGSNSLNSDTDNLPLTLNGTCKHSVSQFHWCICFIKEKEDDIIAILMCIWYVTEQIVLLDNSWISESVSDYTVQSDTHWTFKSYNLILKVVFLFQRILVITVWNPKPIVTENDSFFQSFSKTMAVHVGVCLLYKKKISVLPEMAVHGYLSTILNIDLVFYLSWLSMWVSVYYTKHRSSISNRPSYKTHNYVLKLYSRQNKLQFMFLWFKVTFTPFKDGIHFKLLSNQLCGIYRCVFKVQFPP